VERWQYVEMTARRVCELYGYTEIRTPIIEREELFTKGTGQTTDIVQKEMYSFTDRGDERVTLRPEATPGVVRAFVEHALEQALTQPKLYSLGPMFRYERPQKGRYRQFHQLNVEVFGVADPSIDAELMEMAASLIHALGITGSDLVINSVGCPKCRPKFSAALMKALGVVLRRTLSGFSIVRLLLTRQLSMRYHTLLIISVLIVENILRKCRVT
jgi:histidyl-tRNA synthetase